MNKDQFIQSKIDKVYKYVREGKMSAPFAANYLYNAYVQPFLTTAYELDPKIGSLVVRDSSVLDSYVYGLTNMVQNTQIELNSMPLSGSTMFTINRLNRLCSQLEVLQAVQGKAPFQAIDYQDHELDKTVLHYPYLTSN